jgi:outer membrane murein-binding lipoprotein Lpp
VGVVLRSFVLSTALLACGSSTAKLDRSFADEQDDARVDRGDSSADDAAAAGGAADESDDEAASPADEADPVDGIDLEQDVGDGALRRCVSMPPAKFRH